MNTKPGQYMWACRALVVGLLAGVCMLACNGAGPNLDQNLNDNAAGFSLAETIAGMLADLQRARECGDASNPLPTAEQLEAALMTTHQDTAETTPFDEFVLQQAQIFSDHADVQCGITAGENANLSADP